MITIHDILQGSDEWFELRKGKLTSSKATCIGANGKGLKTYCKEKALELMGIDKDPYTNSDMERGNEEESIAGMAYEFETGLKIQTVGFITNSKFKGIGGSPDFLINKDGGLEIKARNNKRHFDLIVGEADDIPYNQIQMCLLITERKWWDFASFNPNLSKSLYIKRYYPDKAYFEKLKMGFYNGKKLIKQYTEEYENFKN